jgi:hypothetical protein
MGLSLFRDVTFFTGPASQSVMGWVPQHLKSLQCFCLTKKSLQCWQKMQIGYVTDAAL